MESRLEIGLIVEELVKPLLMRDLMGTDLADGPCMGAVADEILHNRGDGWVAVEGLVESLIIPDQQGLRDSTVS